MESLRRLVASAGLLFISSQASAQSFMVSEGLNFMDAAARDRNVGIEIEFKGLADEQIRALILKHYPQATISGDAASGYDIMTEIGKIRVVIEGSAYKYENDPAKFEEQKKKDLLEAPREIVFPPVKFEEIARMHELSQDLKAAGAIGTTEENAVSIQSNLEMRQLVNKKSVKYLLDLMRNFYNPRHRQQVTASYQVPAKRLEYIGDPSPGMMRKINDLKYKPTPRDFFGDFMYRQSLEILGEKNAWKMPIEEARFLLLSRTGEDAVVPRVMKMMKLRISSLLLLAFPEDELTKRVVASRWARPMPIVEFREENNDFNLLPKVRSALGTARAAELFGAYDHDTLFSSLTGMAKQDIVRIREGLRSGRNIIRYVLMSPDQELLTSEDRDWLRRRSPGVIQIQLSPERIGAMPMVLQEGTRVWHRRNIHRSTILGDTNPGLENALLQQAIENKLVEALAFNKYAPGSFPETISMKSVPGTMTAKAPELAKLLSERFPQGWVLKGAWDLSSEKIIVTDKIDFDKAMRAYEKGFEAFKKQMEKKYGGSDPETLIYHLKKHPGYIGYKIMSLLQDRDLLLVQQRRNLVEEFRVEVQGGRVLGQGSTIPRYAYLKKKKEKPTPLQQVIVNQAEAFAQSVVDQLPAELRALPYGIDVAVTEEGDWVMIETNPGGNSSFLEENGASSRALLEYLRTYTPPTTGLLAPAEQMSWIQKHLAEFGLQGSEMYPGIELGVDRFEDKAFSRVKSTPWVEEQSRRLQEQGLPRTCRDVVSKGA